MPDEDRILELLDETLNSGRSPEEVCADDPEFLAEVRRRWERCLAVQSALDNMFPASGPFPPDGFVHAKDTGDVFPEIPGYDIRSVLGRGGQGIVFHAHHRKLNRSVALKMLVSGVYATERDLSCFKREAEAIARLRDAHIVHVYDIGDIGGRPYFTMEFVEGGTLAQRLKDGPQSVEYSAELTATLAEAVHVAHRAGIVHRDLKPSNVLLTTDGLAKISDFGLARSFDGDINLTVTHAAVGTPSYMAPEQSSGATGALGPAADIYSLGAIFYELLTGITPLKTDVVAPSRLNRKVSKDLETICLKCLHQDPARRYASASALADDLRRSLRGEPILARPVGALERSRKWVSRRPAMATAIVALTLVVIGAGTATVLLLADRAETRRAVEADLKEAVDWERRGDWAKAAVALDRAEIRLANRKRPELRTLVAENHKLLETVARLDQIRLTSLSATNGRSPLKMDAATAYLEQFRAAGIGTVGEPPAVIASRIVASPIREAWVAAIDSWWQETGTPADRNWLMSVARAADPDPSGWRDRVRTIVALRDKTTLAELIRTAEVKGQSAQLQVVVGQQYIRHGGDGLAYLRKVQRAHPDDFWVNLSLAVELTTRAPSEEAVGYARAAVALRPREAAAHSTLAGCVGTLGRVDEEIEGLRIALALDDKYMPAHNNIAIQLASKGLWDEAEQHLRRALELDPSRPSVDVQMGAMYYVANKLDESRAHYEKALKADPNNASAHTDLGMLLLKLKDRAGAIAEFEKAMELDPKDVGAMMQMVYVKLQDGQLPAAEEFARRAMAAAPRNDDAHIALRAVLKAEQKYDELAAVWGKDLESRPANHELWYGYAELCLFLGKEDQYRQCRTDLLELFGRARDGHVAERVGRACMLLDATPQETDIAVSLCDRAVAVDPTKKSGAFPFFMFAKGLSLYRQGKFIDAIEIMRGDASRSIKPGPQLVLAMALSKTGDSSGAATELDSAVRSYDWDPAKITGQDGWILHILRREAEATVAGR